MTALTMHRPWTSPTLLHSSVVRHLVVWVDLLNAAAAVLRPLVVTAGVIIAAATSSPPAHADSLGGPITNTLNKAGIGNNGPAASPSRQASPHY